MRLFVHEWAREGERPGRGVGEGGYSSLPGPGVRDRTPGGKRYFDDLTPSPPPPAPVVSPAQPSGATLRRAALTR